MNSTSNISFIERFFHWTVALLMIGLLSVGIYMEEFSAYSLYPIHKSMGVLALLLILPRVVVRIAKGWPAHAGEYAAHEKVLAKVAHWVLILGTLLMPISGMLMSGLGGRGIYVFGVELMAKNLDAAGEVLPINPMIAGIAHEAHGWIAYVVIGALVLHIAGAIKHHVMDKDRTLMRMVKGE